MHCKILFVLVVLVLGGCFGHFTVTGDNPPAWEWTNPYTLTTYKHDAPDRTTVYSFPQVVFDGESYVEYVYERVGQNEFWVQCPSSSFHIKTSKTEIWDPERTEEIISKCIWQLWRDDEEIEDSDSAFTVNEKPSSLEIHQNRVMTDGSEFDVTWTFSNIAKYTIDFKAGQTGNYSIQWKVEIPKASDYTETETGLIFSDLGEFRAYLDYYDAGMYVNGTSIQPLGGSGRKATITFADKEFQAGETIQIDPTVSTYYSESLKDGHILHNGATYPPIDENLTDTISTTNLIGQWKLSEYKEYRIFLSFDTSDLASANVSGAILKIYNSNDWSGESHNIRFYYGYFGTTLNASTDWDSCSNYAGILTSVPLETETYHQKDVPLDSINTTGLSQYRLVSSREEDDVTPTTIEITKWCSGNHETYPPILEIYYVETEEPPPASSAPTPTGRRGDLDDVYIPPVDVDKIPILGLWVVVGGVGIFGASAVIKKMRSPRRRKPRGVQHKERSTRSPRKTRQSKKRSPRKPRRSKSSGRFQ